MSGSPLDLHQASPVELREQLDAQRAGHPFLLYRDAERAQRIVALADASRLVIGRAPECDVPLSWDRSISRVHAALERVGSHWMLVDDGLSRNGTLVAGERVAGRRRLRDGDRIQIGDVVIGFRERADSAAGTTWLSPRTESTTRITEAQRRVLIALCRPFKGGATDAVPATNPEIARELFLTVAAVKTHLRALFAAFGIDDLPQQRKRRQLVTLAFTSGAVRERDL